LHRNTAGSKLSAQWSNFGLGIRWGFFLLATLSNETLWIAGISIAAQHSQHE
jgi:hypothetical protein